MGLKHILVTFFSTFLIFTAFGIAHSDYNLEEDKLRQIFYIEDEIARLNDLIFINDTKIKLYTEELENLKAELKNLNEFISFSKDSASFNIDEYESELKDINNFKTNLDKLKSGYRERLIWLYKTVQSLNRSYFSAQKNFNEFYSRLKYLNKLSELRKRNLDHILRSEYILNQKKEMQKLSLTKRKEYFQEKKDQSSELNEKIYSIEAEMNKIRELTSDYMKLIDERKSLIATINKRIQFIKEPFIYKINQVVDYPDTNFEYLKGKLILPVNSVDIINSFGTYINPETFTISQSNGITVSISQNSEVKVVASGTIEDILYTHILGDIIIVNHGNGYRTVYGSTKPVGIVKGINVKAGDVIGWTQSSGYGQSFHFELWIGKEPVDPIFWFRRG